jgi:hypothetical protein
MVQRRLESWKQGPCVEESRLYRRLQSWPPNHFDLRIFPGHTAIWTLKLKEALLPINFR